MEANTGPSVDPMMTVSQAWAGYSRSRVVDPVTLCGYEGVFALHVEPELGSRPIASVDTEDVRRLLAAITARGLSASTARLCRVALSVVCRHAAGLGVIDRLPTEGVPAPRSTPRPPRVMTPEEFVRIRENLPTAGARLLADLLVCTGLRAGEALALMPGDVGGGCVVVRRALTEPGRRFAEDGQRFVLRPSPKNGEQRSVAVGEHLIHRISDWCADQTVGAGELVFPGRLVLPEPAGAGFPRGGTRSP